MTEPQAARIDVHIIADATQRALAWHAQCLASLEHPAIVVHHVEAPEPLHMGRARAEGFALGAAEWVGVCNPEDHYEPGAWDAFIAAIDAHPDAAAIYANERLIDTRNGEQRVRPLFPTLATRPREQVSQMHGAAVFRREVIAPVLSLIADAPVVPLQIANLAALTTGPVYGIVDMLYTNRLYDGNPRLELLRQPHVVPAHVRAWIKDCIRRLP